MKPRPLPDTLRAKPSNNQNLKAVLPHEHRSLIDVPRQLDPMRVDEPRLGDGRICQILSARVGREAFLFSPEGEGGAGGEGGGTPGAGGEKPPATFTQADLDRVVGQRLADERKKFSDYDTLKAQAAKAAEHEAELIKLKDEAELKGKTTEEQNRINSERAAKRIEQERQEYLTKLTASEKRAEEAESKHRNMIIESGLGSGLDASKVLASARDKAIKALRDDSKVELDDDGKIIAVTYAGVAYKTPAEAATAFLKDNDFFAAGTVPPGGGTKRPNGSAGMSGEKLFEQPMETLLQMANQRTQR